ncbi:hypothetical protein PMI41_01891 [Phyllobacterium sp. YR531]|nr:hypothetical protein PMI41_01891 [Phyllobacterium sp. YR531]
MNTMVQFKTLPSETELNSQLLQERSSNQSSEVPLPGDFVSFYNFDTETEKLWVVVSRYFRYLSPYSCLVEVVVDAMPE